VSDHGVHDAKVRTFLIVESGFTGHLLVFVRVLAMAALQNGSRVTLALRPAALSSDEFDLHLGELSGLVDVVTWEGALTVPVLASLARKAAASDIVVPHADPSVGRLLAGSLTLREFAVHLLIMRDPRWEIPAPLPRRAKNAVKLAVITVLEKLPGVRVVWLREPGYVRRENHHAAIDPFIADGTAQEIAAAARDIRSSLQSTAPVFWVGVTGAISRHKNIPLIVDAVCAAKERQPELQLGLAFIGPIGSDLGMELDEIVDRCASALVPLYVDDRKLSNFEMNGVVGALDAVVMAYSTHSPNSTLGKAWVLGTRVIAAGPRSIRRFVRSIGAGFESALTVTGLAKSLMAAYDSARPPAHPAQLSVGDFTDSVLGLNDADKRRRSV
jgi:hypothetical protein